MNVCSSVGQRLKSIINEPKRRRNYVREKDIFIHTTNVLYPAQFNFYERFQAFDCVWQRLLALDSVYRRCIYSLLA